MYFYFDTKDSNNRTPVTLVASLLKQLVSYPAPFNKIPPSLKELFDEYVSFCSSNPSQQPRKPDIYTLVDVFINCSKEYPPVFVMLDAFDECSFALRGKVISLLTQFHDSGMRIYITTRPYLLEDLTTGPFNGASTMKITANPEDVESYIRERLRNPYCDECLMTEIVKTVTSGIDGMYTRSI